MPNKQVELVRIRDRNEITLPKKTREFLGVVVGDYIEFVQQSDGGVTAHKVIPQRVENHANKNYQTPESGEESKSQGGNKHEQMADRTTPESNTTGLDAPERKSHKSNNAGA